MRLAVVSDSGLPDARVEKELYVLHKRGFSTYFIGPYNGLSILPGAVISDVVYVRWNRLARLGVNPYYHWVKRRISKALGRIKPDIVIAVNIFAAIIVKELGYPLIFDDHEIYSLEVYCDKPLYEKGLLKQLVWRRKYSIYRQWERRVSEVAPTLVVSHNAKRYYQKLGASKVFVLKNYPLKMEAPSQRGYIPCNELRLSYIGSDISSLKRMFRNMLPTIRILESLSKYYDFVLIVWGDRNQEIQSRYAFIQMNGYVEHMKLYEHLSRMHAGLLTWYPVWFHKYANPNKAYIYAISGSIPVIVSSLESVVEDLDGLAIIIDENRFEEDLKEKLAELMAMDCNEINKMRSQIASYAQSNLVWEKQEVTLIEAIQTA